MNRPTLIVDLDDTCIHTTEIYEAALDRWVRLMASQGIEADHARLTFASYDRVHREPAIRHAFPENLAAVYRLLAVDGLRQPPDPAVLERCRHLGYAVFARRARLVDGAHAALGYLRASGFRLALYTHGDPPIQMKRIHEAGLEAYFDSLTVVAEKTPARLRRFLCDWCLRPDECVMIGDSLLADIVPALAERLRGAVWVGGDPAKAAWIRGPGPARAIQRLTVAAGLREVPDALRRINAVAEDTTGHTLVAAPGARWAHGRGGGAGAGACPGLVPDYRLRVDGSADGDRHLAGGGADGGG